MPNYTNSVSRGLNEKLGELPSVLDFGAVGDGSTDSTAAFQKAIDAIEARGGGFLNVPRGTFIVSGLTLPNNCPITIEGDGIDASIIKLKDAADADVFVNKNAGTLFNSNTSPAGVFRLRIANLTIDGNKANQTTGGYGIKLYGHGFTLVNVCIQNCKKDGLYTEYATEPLFTATENDLEANFSDIRTIFNDGCGFRFRGPHDSILTGLVSYQNGEWGLITEYDWATAKYNGNALHASKVNTYLNTSGGIKLSASFIGSDVAATSATGYGMDIPVDCGACQIINGTWAGPTALRIANANNLFHGLVVNSEVSGVELSNAAYNLLNFYYFANTGKLVKITGGIANTIIANGMHPLAATGLLDGTPSSSDSIWINGAGPGNTAMPSYIKFPDSAFNWDSVNKRLGLNVTPAFPLDLKGTARVGSSTDDAALYMFTTAAHNYIYSTKYNTTGENPLTIAGSSGSALSYLIMLATDIIFRNPDVGGITRMRVKCGSGQSFHQPFGVQDASGNDLMLIGPNGEIYPQQPYAAIYAMNGSPEGVISAAEGSICMDRTTGAAKLWVKADGSGSIGWVSTTGGDLLGKTLTLNDALPYFRLKQSGVLKFEIDKDGNVALAGAIKGTGAHELTGPSAGDCLTVKANGGTSVFVVDNDGDIVVKTIAAQNLSTNSPVVSGGTGQQFVSGKIDLHNTTSHVTGTLDIGNGGTGATTAATARTALGAAQSGAPSGGGGTLSIPHSNGTQTYTITYNDDGAITGVSLAP